VRVPLIVLHPTLAARTLLALFAVAGLVLPAVADPFYMGADISLETFMQDQGVVFTDNGVPKPMDKILYDHGANLFRLRIFVNPETVYTDDSDDDPTPNYGAIQTLDYTLALAQQIKTNAPNAKLLLDFHYSDTWADPGKQFKPAAWTSLSLAQLQTRVREYTRDTLLAFESAGVMPQMVQIGNETDSGMLWNSGRVNHSGLSSWVNFGSLVNSGIQGVREAQGAGPKIDVAVHFAEGDWDGHPQYSIDNLTHPSGGNVSDFDVIGVSYYPSTESFHSFALLEENLNELADDYPDKKIMILETNYPWRNSGVGTSQWAKTPAGQQQFLTDLRDMMLGLNNDAGAGIVWWYPEAVNVAGYQIYNNGDTALFNSSRNALPALSAFHITLPTGDFNDDGVVDALDYTVWRNGLGTEYEEDDYLIWKENYGTILSPGGGGLVSDGPHSVPEPASTTLLLASALLIVRKPRRR
jgi:arabinogalactan endo-1,4-beta-galactosidase